VQILFPGLDRYSAEVEEIVRAFLSEHVNMEAIGKSIQNLLNPFKQIQDLDYAKFEVRVAGISPSC
jgi:hypothetical protein